MKEPMKVIWYLSAEEVNRSRLRQRPNYWLRWNLDETGCRFEAKGTFYG